MSTNCEHCERERTLREQAERELARVTLERDGAESAHQIALDEVKALSSKLAASERMADELHSQATWLKDRYEDCYNAAGCEGLARHPVELWNWIEGMVESEKQAERELAAVRADALKRGVHLDNGRTLTCLQCGEVATGVCTHMAENAEKRAEYAAEARSLRERLTDAQRERDEAWELLLEFQWTLDGDFLMCPCCGVRKPSHKSDCRLAQAIGRKGGR